MNIEFAILAIGSELLEGSVTDTNSGFIGGRMSRIGARPVCIRLVPDDKAAIIKAINEVAETYPLIITTGGLGPTFDDITAECVAEAAGRKLVLNEKAFAHMKNRLDYLKVKIHEGHHRQAMLPDGCDLFNNYSGTALGFGVHVGNAYVISMPGVPFEMTEMFDNDVIPYIKANYALSGVIHEELHFGYTSESDVDKAMLDIGMPENVRCIINAGKSEIIVKLRSEDGESLNNFAGKLAACFPSNFLGYGEASPAQALVQLLKEKNATVSTAESCTGGLIGKFLTDIPGVSKVFLGGVVSYSNELKMLVLDVKKETLERYGAVSSETASEMASGAIRAFSSDYAVSVTGIAGPDGGSDEKPVGTVYVGVSNGVETVTRQFFFRGNRESIRTRSTNAAIFTLIGFIRGTL